MEWILFSTRQEGFGLYQKYVVGTQLMLNLMSDVRSRSCGSRFKDVVDLVIP
ncbi:hypothetical protein M422DRAFT_25814 [Sphaerobolus stellatus SS14]|uniref:Uncharacterized protein n=1 Tax=Sphaerobolus stellatus (strain SS14) TaxID=990650 RepID=A0A0C9VXC8_SPHS4|nr:hypothetical protein M422DRAFT_30962 [Sphaerobolus stellatus SS14]KIJ52750.1 hypothetical protein M422DRAFT_25814 [Sphaerobolus stellatus SS14]